MSQKEITVSDVIDWIDEYYDNDVVQQLFHEAVDIGQFGRLLHEDIQRIGDM